MPKKAKKASGAEGDHSSGGDAATPSKVEKESDDATSGRLEGVKRRAGRKALLDPTPAADDMKKSKRGLKSAKDSPTVLDKDSEEDMHETQELGPVSTKKNKRAPVPKVVKEKSEADSAGTAKRTRGKQIKELSPDSEPEAKKLKKATQKPDKAATKQDASEKVVIERTPIPRYTPKGRSFKAITWNVTTLRSLVNKNSALLKMLFEKENPDLVCLQETKLNPEDRDDFEAKLTKIIPGYSFHWNFCTLPDSKSYSGTLAIVRGLEACDQKQKKTLDAFFAKDAKKAEEQQSSASGPVISVSMGLPTLSEADGAVAKDVISEGRTITVEYESFYVVASYVPNSGDKLQRLDFRTKIWDKRMGEYLVDLERKKPVIFCGDLNVAHLDSDIWNAEAKHISKSAGTTPEERQSFSDLLSLGFVDAFRYLNPDAGGWFSYWSVRAGNRPFNRGLRLDYFVTSSNLCGEVAGKAQIKEVAILPDFVALDHAAVVLTMEI